MYGDDSKETGWVEVAPGVAFQVEWDVSDYRIAAHGDEEVPGKLTGKVRMTRDAAFEANYYDVKPLPDGSEEGN